jgi:hypothetical protein
MDPLKLVPSADPTALPAPVWLLQALLLLTFTLHLVPMNFLLGGGLYALVLKLRREPSEDQRQLRELIVKLLPTVMAAAITLGVAPLLFLQLIYGQFFYSSSILMGGFWLLLIPVLIFIYYSFYKESMGGAPRLIFALAALAVLDVAFLLSYNNQLMLDPSGWWAHYVDGGNRLAFSGDLFAPTFWSRLLHMITGALAVTGLWLFVAGLFQSRREAKHARWLKRQGAHWFLGGVGVSTVTGFWYLFALPEPLRGEFLNGSPSGGLPWMLGIVLALLGGLMLRAASGRQGAGAPGKLGLTLALLSLLLMIWQRFLVREKSLALSEFSAAESAVDPQWGVLGLFALIFVLGIATLWAMLRWALRPSV